MVEPMIFFALGALAAGVCALLILPPVHARAVRLAARRLEANIPVSLAQIRADKDLMRAEFALAAHRYEMTIEQLKTKMTEQRAELGRKTDELNRLKASLGEETISAPDGPASIDHGPTVEPVRPVERPLIRLADLAKLAPDIEPPSLVPGRDDLGAPLSSARFEPAGTPSASKRK
ncbi:MAG TPA: hypothetical protein VKB15_11195 [Xanthobacteraceae bacterium]|nr:hypothetical protein [Xanthobacteraceae bacterium]